MRSTSSSTVAIRTLLAALLVSGALSLAIAGPASAGTLDQQQPSEAGGSYAISSDESLAQSFTAGISGNLDQADLFLTRFGMPSAPMNVQIRNISSGSPGDSVLASAQVPASAVSDAGGWVSFNFAAPAPVQTGNQYALVAYSPATFPSDDAWTAGSGNPYGPGNTFMTASSPPAGPWSSNLTNDFAFKTYVAPPTSPSGSPSPTPSPTGHKRCKRKKHRKHKSDARAAKKCKKHKKRR